MHSPDKESFEKIFSGSPTIALAVKSLLEANQINYIERNDIQSGINAGFGIADQAVHIFVPNMLKDNAIELLHNAKLL